MNTAVKLAVIQSQQQDFEWYPTTSEMIETVKKDVIHHLREHASILDCGAGDGRVLMAMTRGDRFAIEKSQALIRFMDPSISIVGTDFCQQTLIDKKVDVIFCNPPYSEYAEWMAKIIREANAQYLYLVVPQRWNENPLILDVIKRREAEVETLGSFDFMDAERRARAKVNILKISLCFSSRHREGAKVDPFNVWFDENFKIQINKSESSKFEWANVQKSRLESALKTELVAGGDLVNVLEKLYQSDLEKLIQNYKSLEEIDPDLLRELDCNVNSLKAALRMKIEGLKDRFWKELFDNLGKITSKLSTGSRKRMLERLMRHVHVDFTVSNAYAILIWVLKNANVYFDDQLIELVERMTEQANISLYVSNKNTFGDERWRYCRVPGDLDRYALDYRCVLHRLGGISTSPYSWENSRHSGLDSRAFDFINDVLTVANNLGFDTSGVGHAGTHQWRSNQAVVFFYFDRVSQSYQELMKVRAFKNGNLHIHFNQAFMCRLNVEFGRLKGWIKCKQEAARELGITLEEADAGFNSNLKLEASHLLKLGFTTCEAA